MALLYAVFIFTPSMCALFSRFTNTCTHGVPPIPAASPTSGSNPTSTDTKCTRPLREDDARDRAALEPER